eukprot:TRINITY_DN250_c0_g1_i1.p1 TRINITY_DN250_c0_g1~~TRINITY_DN250_c0_g1_i1.p1  ORF type:complete len:1320 (-),score=388.27 TRINITY_DN250_c0_g1_i1:100-4059(-)
MSVQEPTDPEQIKADMRKCPRWILLKLQSERQEKGKAEAALKTTRDELGKICSEIEVVKQLVSRLEEKRGELEDIESRIKSSTSALEEKEIVLLQTDKLLQQKTEEAEKYRNFVKEVQEIKMKADNQVQELLKSKDREIAQKKEHIAKLETEAARFKNYIRNAHKSVIFRPDAVQSLFKDSPPVSPSPSNNNSPMPSRTISSGSVVSVGSGIRRGSEPKEFVNNNTELLDKEAVIPIKELVDLVIKDEELRVYFFRKLFLNSPDYELTMKFIEFIEEVGDEQPLDKISSSLTNFFELSAPIEAIAVLKKLITKEVRSSSDETTIFRANNIAAKMLRTYTRMVGTDYLRTTLGPFVAEILTKPESLELDPSKATPDVDVANNLLQVKSLAERIILKVTTSAEAMPLQLRVMYSHLAKEVKNKFGDVFKKFVGGFVFLRLICPAVTSPDSYEFLSGTGLVLTDGGKRTCINLSKILQNVANGISFKEPYLQPLNEWLVVQNNLISNFVDNLIAVASDADKDIDNFAPTSLTMPTADSCLIDIQKAMFDIRVKLAAHFESQKEIQIEGIMVNTAMVLSIILAAGLLALQQEGQNGSVPFSKPFSKILLATEKLLPAIGKQAMKKKGGAFLDSLGQAMVNYWAAFNGAPLMLKNLIKGDIYCTDYVFVDSFSAKVFAYYSQYYSRNMLKQLLEPHLQNIQQNNIALEIEEDRMASSEKHKKAWNIQILFELSQSFYDVIVNVIPKCPIPIWDICKYIESTGSSQDICEFLFFAWFCPAIEEPEKFGLVTETPKASLRRTFNLLSDVMRKVAKGNVFYIKDAAFKQFNQWIELKAEEVNTLIAEWIKEPSTDLTIITQTPPPIDDATRDKALSTIHQFMVTKATFFSHILAEEKFLQSVSFSYHELLEGLIAKPLPSVAPPVEKKDSKQGSGSQIVQQTSSPSLDRVGELRKKDSKSRAFTKLTSTFKKGVGTFIEESSSLFDKPIGGPELGRVASERQIVGSLTKLHEIEDPELSRARERLHETLTSFYNNETPEERAKRMRQEVVGEIISTETSFIRHLQAVKQYLQEPLKTQNIVTAEEIKELFSNLADLIPVNQKLLRNLQGVEDLPPNEQNIGEIFLSLASDLKVYQQFCVDMNKSMRARDRLAKKPQFTAFVVGATQNNSEFPADCKNLDNLLIQPMQRICRYPLLLGELLRRTPDDYEDKEHLKKAVDEISNIVADINELRQEEERTSKLHDIFNRFVPDKKLMEDMVVANNRTFLNEVSIKKMKVGSSGSGKGHLFLFNDLLMIAQPSSTVKNRFNLVSYLPYASSSLKIEPLPKG